MCPSMKRRNQWNSTDARWRTRPSRDIDDGGIERRASCSASRPSHLSSKVIRKWSRYSASTAFSPRGLESVWRGSSSGSTHRSGYLRSVTQTTLPGRTAWLKSVTRRCSAAPRLPVQLPHAVTERGVRAACWRTTPSGPRPRRGRMSRSRTGTSQSSSLCRPTAISSGRRRAMRSAYPARPPSRWSSMNGAVAEVASCQGVGLRRSQQHQHLGRVDRQHGRAAGSCPAMRGGVTSFEGQPRVPRDHRLRGRRSDREDHHDRGHPARRRDRQAVRGGGDGAARAQRRVREDDEEVSPAVDRVGRTTGRRPGRRRRGSSGAGPPQSRRYGERGGGRRHRAPRRAPIRRRPGRARRGSPS